MRRSSTATRALANRASSPPGRLRLAQRSHHGIGLMRDDQEKDAGRAVNVEALLLPALDGPRIEYVALGERLARQSLARPQPAHVAALDPGAEQCSFGLFGRHHVLSYVIHVVS